MSVTNVSVHADPATSSAAPVAVPTEKSLISRFVAILTPVFAVVAGWLAGVVAQIVPGAHLNQNQIVAFMTAAAVSAITAGWKWLQGWQQHEALVAQGKDVPRNAGAPAPVLSLPSVAIAPVLTVPAAPAPVAADPAAPVVPPQAGPAQAGPAQAGPAQAGPAQAGPPQAGPPQAGPPQDGPPQDGPAAPGAGG